MLNNLFRSTVIFVTMLITYALFSMVALAQIAPDAGIKEIYELYLISKGSTGLMIAFGAQLVAYLIEKFFSGKIKGKKKVYLMGGLTLVGAIGANIAATKGFSVGAVLGDTVIISSVQLLAHNLIKSKKS